MRPYQSLLRSPADAVHAEICARAFDLRIGSFVQAYGSRQLDASLLQMPLVDFLPADDSRVQGTIAAMEQRLLDEGGFVMRYDMGSGVDGLPGGEGAFLSYSFWVAGNYVLQDRRAEARAIFERLIALANDVGRPPKP